MVDVYKQNEEAAANAEINKSVRDLLSMKMTIPLGNPLLKNVHTNQFLWTDLPEEFEVQFFERITRELKGESTGFIGYQRNRWYIEKCTITNDGKKFNMELELNPFNPAHSKYTEKFRSFTKAYTDAQKKEEETGAGGGKETSTKSTGNSTLKGGQGELIDNLVKDICGNITDELERCKAIHEWLRKEVRYSWYECCRYSCGGDVNSCYRNRRRLNCADTAVLTCSMMLSAGLNAYIVHRTYNGGHFWCIIEINGKKYASDQTGDGSAFNTVWKSSGRTSVSDGGAYSHRENGFHTC